MTITKIAIAVLSIVVATSAFAGGHQAPHYSELPEGYTGTAEVGMTTDYRFRGISQTKRDPSVQGSLGVAHDSGVYFNVWGSSVEQAANDSGVETDYTLGYADEFMHEGRTYDYDIHYVYYDYPGKTTGNIDFHEFGFSVGTGYTIGDDYDSYASIGYDYAHDYVNSLGHSHYTSIDHDTAGLPGDLVLGLHGGYSHFGNDYTASDDSYWDWSIGISRVIYDFDVELAYVDTDISKNVFGNTTQDTVLLTVSKSFTF